ncbi:MAG TPA: NAD(P)H-binding protein [Gemmataceae bacterium]|nr:NAD(P)H-binding protein [Gemmataceae bacterium]
MASPERILVAGGTGGTGRLVVRRLGLLGIPVRILTRGRRRIEGFGAVDVIQGDVLVEADCRRAIDGCGAVICAVGRHKTRWHGPSADGDGVINLAHAAKQAGARSFILVSALGVGDSWQWVPLPAQWLLRLLDLPPLLREKARSEEFVRSSGLAWTILRPGFLHGWRMRSEPVLAVTGRVPGICGRQAVADAAVRCLSAENARGQVLTIADGWLRPWLRDVNLYRLAASWAPW